jgi:hypothetical protein
MNSAAGSWDKSEENTTLHKFVLCQKLNIKFALEYKLKTDPQKNINRALQRQFSIPSPAICLAHKFTIYKFQ